MKQDTFLYVGQDPVANMKKGMILIRDKYTHRYESSVYLDQTQVAVHESKDTYGMDKEKGWSSPSMNLTRISRLRCLALLTGPQVMQSVALYDDDPQQLMGAP